MRIVLSLLLTVSSASSSADIPEHERRAMRRVLLQFWPGEAHEVERERLITQWAGVYDRQLTFDHRQELSERARGVANLVKLAKTKGLHEDEISRMVKDITVAHQIAAAKRYDQVNYTTGALLLAAAAVPGLVLALMILLPSVDVDFNPLVISAVTGVSAVLAGISVGYMGWGAKTYARNWWSLEAADGIAKRFPGNDFFHQFWTDVDAELNETLGQSEPQREDLRKSKGRLRDFADSMRRTLSADAIARACASNLDVTP